MLAVITIRMDSAAFHEAPGSELCRILHLLARRIETEAPASAVLRDSNGNNVGVFCLDSDWRRP
jgi:hypothetical protein